MVAKHVVHEFRAAAASMVERGWPTHGPSKGAAAGEQRTMYAREQKVFTTIMVTTASINRDSRAEQRGEDVTLQVMTQFSLLWGYFFVHF